MRNLGINLSWIAVKDIDAAIEFYTTVAGFTLLEHSSEHGWAELQGEGGCRLGICMHAPENPIQAGSNAIACITVDNIEKATKWFAQKGVRLQGDMMEIEGHVKIQTFQDLDGNTLQLVEMLSNK